MGLRSFGIGSRLLMLIGICVLPFVFFTLHIAEQERKDEIENARERARTIARVVADEGAKILAHSRQLLLGLSLITDHKDVALFRSDCGQRLNRLLQGHSVLTDMGIADREGNLTCTRTPLQKPVTIADREYFQRAIATKDFAISGLVESRVTGSRALLAAQPLLDQRDEAIGVIVAEIGLNWIQNLLERVELPPGARIVLVDAQGVIIARFPNSGGSIGRSTSDAAEFSRRVASSPEGIVEGKGNDGVERLVAYTKFAELAGGPAFVRVAIPMAEVTKAAEATLRTGLLTVCLVLAISIALAWAGSSYLVIYPVRRLTAAAAQLGKGDLAARTGLRHTNNEIGQLARQLDHLAEHAQRTTRALKALSAGNRTILRERDEGALMHAMCRVVVEKAGYRLAFVNHALNDEGKSIVTVARAGDDSGFIETLKLTWADTERGRGTVGMAVRSGTHCVVRSVDKDLRFAPWRDEAMRRGYGSLASFPLRIDEEIIGTFTLVASEEDAFDADEIELLDEVAADLSFGISVIRSRILRDEAERRADRAATHDALTDLPNDTSFIVQLGLRIKETQNAREPLAVLIIHLPRLQEIYDTLGYDPGNAIVTEIASRLRQTAVVNGHLARLASEDFAVMLAKQDAEGASNTARAVLVAFQSPVQIGDARFDVQASIGASFCPGHGDEAELLVRRAGIAAREAARKSLDYLAYRGATERENPARLELVAELRSAIEQRTLVLHYQPKVDLATGHICACEALVRWPHPVKGMIPPVQFVPVAEQTGLIREMTYLVLDTAVRQQRSWLDAGKRLPIAVNLSVSNLYDSRLLERIDGLFTTWGLPAELIEFEITESALIEDPESAKTAVAALRQLGSKVYIDDFGTGYSSLSYLVSLPVNALKIDRAFVIQMTKSPQAHSVVASIISMAHGLGLRVVAEGVETKEEQEELRAMQCDEVQGYLISKPVPPEAFLRLLESTADDNTSAAAKVF